MKSAGLYFFSSIFLFHQFCMKEVRYPHSTEIFRTYCRNIPWKYCKIAKIFKKLSIISVNYYNNLAISAQNMIYAILSKYYQNKQCFF